MHAPVEFLRGLIGFIGIGCAYLAGRATVAVRKGWQKPSRLTGWILSFLPIVLGVSLYLVNPENMSLLWKREIGVKLLYTAAGMTIAGALIIRKIVRMDV